MSTFWKIFIGFWIIWLIWYWSGGPQRTTNVKPYVRYDHDTMKIHKSNVDLETGAREMLTSPAGVESSLEQIDYNLRNPSFTEPAY